MNLLKAFHPARVGRSNWLAWRGGRLILWLLGLVGLILALSLVGQRVTAATTIKISLTVTGTTIFASSDPTGASLVYISSDSSSCDSGTDFADSTAYTAQIEIDPVDHLNKYFCFKATSGSDDGYGVTGAIGTYPVILSISSTPDSLVSFGDAPTFTVTFSEDLEFRQVTNGPDMVLVLNVRSFSSTRGEVTTAAGILNDNQISFQYQPQDGDYTLGASTYHTLSDDEPLQVVRFILGEGNQLVDADGNQAILEIGPDNNLPETNHAQVNLIKPILVLTTTISLETTTEYKRFLARDDLPNSQLENNGYSERFEVFVFETYFIPASLVSQTDLEGDAGDRQVDRNCALNSYDIAPSSYQEGLLFDVREERYNNHYLCFRSRHSGDDFVGGADNLGFSGEVTGLIRNIVIPVPVVTVDVGSAVNTFKAVDDFTTNTHISYQFIDGSNQACDKQLDWSSFDIVVLGYSEGGDVTFDSARNGQRICFRSHNTAGDGKGYAASAVIDAVPGILTITDISATSDSYGEAEEITITVTFSDDVTLDTTANSPRPQLVLDLPGRPTASYVEQPTPSTLSFLFTVRATDTQADLNVSLFDLNGSSITDADSNNLDTGIPSGNNLADTSDVVLDTTPPVITVSPLSSNNQVSATATDILAPAPSLSSQILASGDCDANTADNFSPYTAGDLLTLDPGQKACFKATDAAANTAYAVSAVGVDDPAPIVTVSAGSVANSFKASDDQTATATTWSHAFISQSSTCGGSIGFPTGVSYTEGQDLSYTDAHNNRKVCFRSTDGNNKRGYAASAVIDTDTTAPTITVSPSGDDATAKQMIIVSASSTDTDLDSTSWLSKVITSDAACDETTMASGVSTEVVFDQESLNNHKVCFSVTDQADNTAYQASGVISGIDTTPPTITVSPLSSNNQVSATVSDILDSAPSLSSQILASGDCDANTADSFSPYTAGDLLTLTLGQKACFKATDNAANTAYAVSDVGVDDPAPIVTVSAGSVANSFTASDDQTATTTTWSYAFISQSSTCGGSIGFPTGVSYTEGQDLSYTDAHNNRKVCFRSTDGNNKRGYAASAVIDTDTTAPTITVTPSGDDATAKQMIIVSASSTDTDLDSTSWLSKVITSDAACDETTMASGVSTEVVFDQESLNNHKVCFSVTDQADNTAYQASGVISGIDTTPPTITVSPLSSNNQVSATVSDILDSAPSLSSQILASGDCDANTADSFSPYTAGDLLTLTLGQKACFKATDNAANTAYAVSDVGADITPPVITVTPSGDDATAKQTITVSASSTDTDLDLNSWAYKLIASDAACDATTMADATSTDTMVILDQESHNNRKVCFSVTDQADNTAYQASGVISGIDTTPPVITVSPLSSNSQVSATVSDILDPAPSLSSQILASNFLCYAATAHLFTTYTAGDLLILAPGQKACFKATDNAANTAYAVSDVGVDITVPRSSDTTTTTVTGDDQTLPADDAKPTEQTGSDTAQPAAASEISDLSDDDDSNTSTIIIGLLAIFVITILATRSRRNRSQSDS